MKIAYLTNYFPSLTETFIYREVKEVRRRGIDVATYSLRRPDPASISKESVPLFSTTSYLLPVGLPVLLKAHLALVLSHPCRYATTLIKMVSGSHGCARDRFRTLMHFGEGVVMAERLKRDGVGHIHAHFASQSASVARVVHLLTGIPYSFTGHAHDIWWDQLLLREKLDEAEFAVTCSDRARQTLLEKSRRIAPGKVHLIYHGLNVEDFPYCANHAERERNLILGIGRLTPTKGFPDLIVACSLLRSRGLRFRCVIVGEGEERAALERLISSRGLADRVVLVGAVPQEGVRAYYRRAWVFALPCVDTRDGNRDGIPNVLMEAMASGVPVVTTTNSGQPELIHHGIHGLLVPPGSPEELAGAIALICEKEELRERMVSEARRRIVEDFDSRKTIEPLIRLFEGLCGK